jgi:hypothetical protein
MTSANSMINKLTKIISTKIYMGQEMQVKTQAIDVGYLKNNVSLMPVKQYLDDAKIELTHSFCELLSNMNCSSRILTQKVTILKVK